MFKMREERFKENVFSWQPSICAYKPLGTSTLIFKLISTRKAMGLCFSISLFTRTEGLKNDYDYTQLTYKNAAVHAPCHTSFLP